MRNLYRYTEFGGAKGLVAAMKQIKSMKSDLSTIAARVDAVALESKVARSSPSPSNAPSSSAAESGGGGGGGGGGGVDGEAHYGQTVTTSGGGGSSRRARPSPHSALRSSTGGRRAGRSHSCRGGAVQVESV
jgi:hypothetical protein